MQNDNEVMTLKKSLDSVHGITDVLMFDNAVIMDVFLVVSHNVLTI